MRTLILSKNPTTDRRHTGEPYALRRQRRRHDTKSRASGNTSPLPFSLAQNAEQRQLAVEIADHFERDFASDAEFAELQRSEWEVAGR